MLVLNQFSPFVTLLFQSGSQAQEMVPSYNQSESSFLGWLIFILNLAGFWITTETPVAVSMREFLY